MLYGVPDAQPIKAVLAIQPTKLTAFNTNFARTELGPLGPGADQARRLPLRGAAVAAAESRRTRPIPARKLNGTVVQYVQGTGDQWGEMAVVEAFAAATPHTAGPVIAFPSTERYSGYQYISERSADVVAFFDASTS